MEFNLLTLAGISLALMFFGYFFGLFEGRGQGAKKYKDEEERNKGVSGLVVDPLPPPSPPLAPETNNLLASALTKGINLSSNWTVSAWMPLNSHRNYGKG